MSVILILAVCKLFVVILCGSICDPLPALNPPVTSIKLVASKVAVPNAEVNAIPVTSISAVPTVETEPRLEVKA